MPQLYNVIAEHPDGKQTIVSECPQPYPLARREWQQYISAGACKRRPVRAAINVERAGVDWVWIDTALGLQ